GDYRLGQGQSLRIKQELPSSPLQTAIVPAFFTEVSRYNSLNTEKESSREYQNTRHNRRSLQGGGQGGTGERGDYTHVSHGVEAGTGRRDYLCQPVAVRETA